MNIRHFRELEVYQIAKKAALEIFGTSKSFPEDERFALTLQIRRSSRSVCANISEAWRRRRYEAAFIAKLNDSEAECAETQVWLEFANEHGYISKETFLRLDDGYEHISAMLIKMCDNPKPWLITK
jgi:four helix bundle protein